MKRIILLFFLFAFIGNMSYAQNSMAKAQANFVYNFTKFFDWPQSEKTGDFVIGVLGSRDLATELEKVTAGKKNVTQDIVVKYFSNFNQVTKCQVIFVDAINASKVSSIHTQAGVHCLVISDSYSAIENGAVIQFIVEANRLKYAFSESNALKHGLKFHSKVKEMASENY